MLKHFLASKHLPWILGVAATIVMLPAMKTGLIMDDLIQRVVQLKPEQIPSALYKTGLIPENTGKLSTVLFETFGFSRDKERWRQARNYGVIPWWFSDETKCSFWRPFTAFTHWLDYRVFPDSPVFMHVHNILWFAVIVFLTTIIYRKIIGPTAVAGLAAIMFFLDSNTYFPVMFVANRGFIIALCFGLLCFYTHHKWRTEKSASAAILSFIFFSLALLSNEAGVSAFAFVLAYALVLDKTSLPKRFLTLLPAISIIIVWRMIYHLLGFGVSGIGAAYLDPGREPLKFLYHLPNYLIAIIAGQFSSLPPDMMLAFNTQWLKIIFIFYVVFAASAVILLLPLIRKNTLARFWFVVMIFAAVPIVAAPVGKNFGFVAIGAYGLIAVFAGDLIQKQSLLSLPRFYKYSTVAFCVILLIIHIPLAFLLRLTIPKMVPDIPAFLGNSKGLENISNDSQLVIVNVPCHFSASIIPFNAAYYGLPIPKSIHSLASAYSGLEIKRIADKTLVVTSKETSIFMPNQQSPVHFAYFFAVFDKLFVSGKIFEKNRTFVLEDMTIEVLELDKNNFPKKLSFAFKSPLESKIWLQFNWNTFSYEPFRLPAVGQTITTQGPPVIRFCDAMHFLSGGLF